tara:strand:- start:355 stop:819 length:465 start_codon:yes stop_codon:yes gene_type:complete
MSIINWLKQPDQYISITTTEKSNQVWGLDWALAHGTTEVQKWESLQEFFSYLSDLVLPPDPTKIQRSREIALYTEDPKVLDRLNVDPDSPFIILSISIQGAKSPLESIAFRNFMFHYIEETGVSPTFRAIWYEENPVENMRQDIRDLLITLVKI